MRLTWNRLILGGGALVGGVAALIAWILNSGCVGPSPFGGSDPCQQAYAMFAFSMIFSPTLLIWAIGRFFIWANRQLEREPGYQAGVRRPDNVRALCSNCGRPQSPYWTYKCNHCGASYERYPPKVESLE
jgi:hypothetical protein